MQNRLRCVLFVWLISAGISASVSAAPDGFVPGRLLVQFRQGVTSEHGKQLLRRLGAQSTQEMRQIGVHVVQLPASASETAYAAVLKRLPEVEFAELDRLLEPSAITPNDPYYPNQWHLPKIQAPAAWDTSTGSSGVIVAIIDTGVDGTHPDLAPKMVPGWNMYDNNPDSRDVYGHGTYVAGTVAAAANNGAGVASIAWQCRIMPVRISDPAGYASDSTIAKGVLWAADNGARVANISYSVTGSSTVSSAARYLQGKGGVLTVSAGNNGATSTMSDDPSMVTVSATDPSDLLYSWSNRGTQIDVAAPGCVYTTARGGGYASVCGTSFSAPTAAGVAALIVSVAPGLSSSDVIRILKESADDLGVAGWDTNYGGGRVNAARAVAMAAAGAPPADLVPPSVSIVSPANGAVVTGTVTVQAVATDNVAVGWVSLAVNGAAAGTDSTAPYTFTWNTSIVANGTYRLTATAADTSGNRQLAWIDVTVNNVRDTAPPTVTITAPASGNTVSGKVSVTVAARDDVGVVRAELYVDGAPAANSIASPFTLSWNTRKMRAGPHTLIVKAYDVAGNAGTSPAVSVTVR